MGKKRSFLGIFAFLVMAIFATNSFAAGYTCDTLKEYTSCSEGYYLNGTGAGNACLPCADLETDSWLKDSGDTWTSAGGTTVGAAASCFKEVTLNKNGFSAEIPADAGTGCRVYEKTVGTTSAKLRIYYNTECTLPTIDGTQTNYANATDWATSQDLNAVATTVIPATTTVGSLPSELFARKSSCAANAFVSDPGVTPTTCASCASATSGAYPKSDGGKITVDKCYIECAAGTRKTTPSQTSCTTTAGNWMTAAHRVYNGHISPIFLAPFPFSTNTQTIAAYHDAIAATNAMANYRAKFTGTIPAGYSLAANPAYAPSFAIRIQNTSTSEIVLNELMVVPSGVSVDSTAGLYTRSIISGQVPSYIYGSVDQNRSAPTDRDLSSGMTMAPGAWIRYDFSDLTNVAFVQATFGNNGTANSQVQILLDLSGSGTWSPITGLGNSNYNQFTTAQGEYDTVIIPAVTWAPCSKGKWSSSVSNENWSRILQYSACSNVSAGCYADTTGSTTACPKSCSALTDDGFYSDTDAEGSDSASDCYGTTAKGMAVLEANASPANCPEGAYCTGGEQIYYGNTGGVEQCPDPMTHKRTSFPSNYSGVTGVSASEFIGSDWDSKSDCQVLTTLATPYGTLQEVATFNTSNNEYDNTVEYSWKEANPGYYLTMLNHMDGAYISPVYGAAQSCSTGSYCPGVTTSEAETCYENNVSDCGLKTCTKPENSSFQTSSELTTDSCPWTCDDGYNQTDMLLYMYTHC